MQKIIILFPDNTTEQLWLLHISHRLIHFLHTGVRNHSITYSRHQRMKDDIATICVTKNEWQFNHGLALKSSSGGEKIPGQKESSDTVLETKN